jgi:uncharacterized protein
VDTRELGRRPGSLRRLSRTVPAPADLGVDVIRVPEETPLDLQLRLEAVMDGVLVSGSVVTTMSGECVRCLDPLERELEVEFQELYVYPDADAPRHADDDDENDLHQLEGDLLDLEPVLRDAVVLALPLQPVCQDDCPGLCSECGQRLADDPDHAHDSADLRWAALQGLFDEKRES